MLRYNAANRVEHEIRGCNCFLKKFENKVTKCDDDAMRQSDFKDLITCRISI